MPTAAALDRADVALCAAKDTLAELAAYADAARMPPPPGCGLKQAGGYPDDGAVLWAIAQALHHAIEATEAARLAVEVLAKHEAARDAGDTAAIDAVCAAHSEL